MDWFLERSAPTLASLLRREIRSYLERHGAGSGARNVGTATVQLQERLALGDPGCRVVVHLGERRTLEGHRYGQ